MGIYQAGVRFYHSFASKAFGCCSAGFSSSATVLAESCKRMLGLSVLKSGTAMSLDTSGITQWLRFHLTDEQIIKFLDNEGINEYSTVSSSSIISILYNNRFPEKHHLDYQWAISEAGVGGIELYSPELRLLVAAIFCYCHRIQMLGTPLESRYYLMGLSAVAEIGCRDLNLRYLEFLKEIYSIGEQADSPEEFFILLSIALMLSMQAAEGEGFYQDVIKKLHSLSMKYNRELDLTVAVEGLSGWHSLDVKLAGGQEQRNRLLAFLPPN